MTMIMMMNVMMMTMEMRTMIMIMMMNVMMITMAMTTMAMMTLMNTMMMSKFLFHRKVCNIVVRTSPSSPRMRSNFLLSQGDRAATNAVWAGNCRSSFNI